MRWRSTSSASNGCGTLQHPEGGQREINELHVPVGRPVKLIMTSEDVIHSFFIPAFRVKQDVVPGRYTYVWFQPTKVGDYHLFCAQYCGTQHSRMVGWVHVMEPDEYQRWLSGKADESMALRGRQLFLKYQCIACHSGDSQAKAPLLEELYLKTVRLRDGRNVTADEDYIRRSIRDPKADIVDPYQPIMPTFGPDQMDEEQLQDLVAFIVTLGRDQTPTRNEATPAPEQKVENDKQETGGKVRRAVSVSRDAQRSAWGRSLRCASRLTETHLPDKPVPFGRLAMTTATVEPQPQPAESATAPRRVDYLNVSFGVRSWLLTTDHKRIAILYLVVDHRHVLHRRRRSRSLIRLELADAQGRPRRGRHLQQALHDARRRDGLLLPDPVDPGGLRQLPRADDDRRQGPGLPAAQPPELVHLHRRRPSSRSGRCWPAASTPAGPSTRPTARSYAHTYVIATAVGVFIAGFSSILTGLNFIVTIHRMRAPGPDLVPPAAVRLGDVRHQPHHAPRHAGPRHHPAARRRRAASPASASSTRRWAATRCCSSTCSGSTRTRPSTS